MNDIAQRILRELASETAPSRMSQAEALAVYEEVEEGVMASADALRDEVGDEAGLD